MPATFCIRSFTGADSFKSFSFVGGCPHGIKAALIVIFGLMARASIETRRTRLVTCSRLHSIHSSSPGAGVSVRPVARRNRARFVAL